MRKLIILVMLISGFNNLYSQDRISVSYSFSPIISNRILKSNGDSIHQLHTSADSYINGRNKVDKFQLGFKTGFNIYYAFNNRFSCYTGLGYIFQRVNQSTLSSGVYLIDGLEVPYYGNSYNSFRAEYHYLSIPIGIMVNVLTKNKITFGINSGFSLDYLVHSIVNKDPITNVDYSENNTFATEFLIGINCDYTIKDKLIVFFKPEFNLFITPNSVDYGLIRNYNYYYNFGIGLKYKINNH